MGLVSESVPHQILCVCRESYEAVSRFYTKCFRSLNSIPDTYFNTEIDTLYLTPDFSYYRSDEGYKAIANELTGGFPILDMENIRKVKKLAILMHHWGDGGGREHFVANLLGYFDHLDELSFVVGHFLLRHVDLGDNQLSITDPVNYEEAMHAYEAFQASRCDVDAKVPDQVGLDTELAEVDMLLLKEILNTKAEDGGPVLKISVIAPKVVVRSYILRQGPSEAFVRRWPRRFAKTVDFESGQRRQTEIGGYGSVNIENAFPTEFLHFRSPAVDTAVRWTSRSRASKQVITVDGYV